MRMAAAIKIEKLSNIFAFREICGRVVDGARP
jgi:hypothetical protein